MSTTDLTRADQAPQSTATPPPPAAIAGDGPSWHEQDGALREMWMRNQTPAAIAEALGRSVPAIMTRAARLGLPRRFSPGRKPGRRPPDAAGTAQVAKTRSTASTAAIGESAEVTAQISTRICLMCLDKFQSMGRHNRICPTCKGSAEYESGSRLPDIDFPVSDA